MASTWSYGSGSNYLQRKITTLGYYNIMILGDYSRYNNANKGYVQRKITTLGYYSRMILTKKIKRCADILPSESIRIYMKQQVKEHNRSPSQTSPCAWPAAR
jgi:hypothetical protein